MAPLRHTLVAAAVGSAALVAALLGPNPAAVSTERPWSPQLVRVDADPAVVGALGLDLTEHGGTEGVDVVLHTAAERARLEASGLPSDVLVPDLLAREAERNRLDEEYAARTLRSPLPSGRTSYRTLGDYETELRDLAREHRSLVRHLTLPEPGLDGHEVHGVEIAHRVRRPADGRPTFVMLGLHHAREWPSAEHTMEFAHDLVALQRTDRDVRRLLRRVRVLVVPVVNPDGFDLSRTSGGLVDLNVLNPLDPTGTLLPVATQVLTPGLAYLRKNCRLVAGVDTPDGTCAAMLSTPAGFGLGVDLNRNYGQWWSGPGAAGAAPSPTEFHAGLLDPRHHGADAFSEPETRNVRDLVLSRQVTTLITNHTSGNLVLRPWAGAPDHVTDGGVPLGLAPDEKALRRLGARFAAENGYTNQRSHELYDGVGTTEDWAYAATGAFGFTFEIGPTEFHPPFEDVVDEYVGADRPGGGNRAAYLIALAHAADTRAHGVLTGRAPAGATLTLTRDASTTTWDGSSPARLRTSLVVPRSGRFTWHVNPSTRPTAERPEKYRLTCDDGPGKARSTRVLVNRGEQVRIDLRRC